MNDLKPPGRRDRRRTDTITHDDLAAIRNRLNEGDARMAKIEAALAANTALTQQIVSNTAGFVAFQDELESGTRFLCRCAKGVQFFLKELVEPYGKPVLIIGVGVYWATHDFTLPPWVLTLLKALAG